MKYRFGEIFRENEDGSLSPTRTVNINGVTFGPGVSFGPGVLFGGINIFDFRGSDVEADTVGNVLVIRGFYRRNQP